MDVREIVDRELKAAEAEQVKARERIVFFEGWIQCSKFVLAKFNENEKPTETSELKAV